MLRRQANVQLDVADRLAVARSHELKAAVIACAALLARFHLQSVALVDGGARGTCRLAFADVANSVELLA